MCHYIYNVHTRLGIGHTSKKWESGARKGNGSKDEGDERNEWGKWGERGELQV